MKHLFIILGALILIIVIAIFNLRFFAGPEDGWLCQDGAWVKHGMPSNPPSGICLKKQNTVAEQTNPAVNEVKPTADAITTEIKIDTPSSNQVISSPLEITGQALGNWYFEASFPVKLIDDKGQIIAQGPATAQSDWMTTDMVPFKAELKFSGVTSTLGMLIFANDNPSGLPENEKQLGVPVRFNNIEKITLQAFFGNSDLNHGSQDCTAVFPVARLADKTKSTAASALRELLAGPTEAEKIQGYVTSINPDVKVNFLTIANGTAQVDFDQQMDYQMGGSCRVSAIRAQIEQTLKQFSSVKNVIISVNGNVDEALQP
jgi:hypothetical protein